MDNTKNKEITRTWISGQNSCTLVIPKSVAIEYGLDSPAPMHPPNYNYY